MAVGDDAFLSKKLWRKRVRCGVMAGNGGRSGVCRSCLCWGTIPPSVLRQSYAMPGTDGI
eukprot:3027544-Rhodomonas_salina.1